jgi:demethoxyubiquinone hydroxylase (CLK1/Coq7/Cat5 family)
MSRATNSLKFMYGMERFATEIYRTQGRAFTGNEIEDKFRAATDNEHKHADDLQKHIIELNGTPSRLGPLFQMAGRLLGFITKAFGKPFILKADI